MQNFGVSSISCRVLHAVFRNFHFTSYIQKTHYEVLKVSQNCSSKDIKDAFIKLSKKFHPDTNKNNPNTHNEFVKVNEAYSVLSRPDKRREYDISLQITHVSPSSAGPNVYQHEVQTDPWKDPSFFRNRDRSKDEENRYKPYYRIGKLGRLSNSWLVGFLFAVTAVGVTLQVFAIRHSMTLRRGALDEASAHRSVLHSEMQEQAINSGNETMLRIIHSRLGGTNADFSLLLSEKKDLRKQQQQEQEVQPALTV